MSNANGAFAQSVLCPPEAEVLEACGMMPAVLVANGASDDVHADGRPAKPEPDQNIRKFDF